MSCYNSNVPHLNIGHSSRLGYDKCSYEDYLAESTAPLLYQMNPVQNNNCNACLSVFGPRPKNGSDSFGVSTTVGQITAPAQELTDIESILSNRNVIASKCKDGRVNDIDINQFNLQHARICNDFLDPVATHLTNPAANYRGMSINRFFDLPKNPQANIYWDSAVNTQLEAKDNYRAKIPRVIRYDPSLPKELRGRNRPCRYQCDGRCPDCTMQKQVNFSYV